MEGMKKRSATTWSGSSLPRCEWHCKGAHVHVVCVCLGEVGAICITVAWHTWHLKELSIILCSTPSPSLFSYRAPYCAWFLLHIHISPPTPFPPSPECSITRLEMNTSSLAHCIATSYRMATENLLWFIHTYYVLYSGHIVFQFTYLSLHYIIQV